MTNPDQQGRPEPPLAGDETATLLGSLERERAILAWKCGGLDAAGLSARLAPSAMTLGGLLKHLALVEDEYFSRRLLGRDLGAPWDTVDWDADPDWEWNSAAQDSPERSSGVSAETPYAIALGICQTSPRKRPGLTAAVTARPEKPSLDPSGTSHPRPAIRRDLIRGGRRRRRRDDKFGRSIERDLGSSGH